MEKVKALIALARKISRVIFAMVRDNTEFFLDHEARYRLVKAV